MSAQSRRGKAKKPTKTFKATIEEATELMPTYQRLFSRVIHTRPISLLSDIAASSILRPNALLLGAVTAFFFTLIAYLLAKNLGYRLSGFEFIGGFACGWLLGLLHDLIRRLFRRKK